MALTTRVIIDVVAGSLPAIGILDMTASKSPYTKILINFRLLDVGRPDRILS